MFAPWEWDNTKIMIWSYLGMLPFLHEMLLEIPRWRGSSARSVCYMLFFSGFISLLGGLRDASGYEIAKRSELDSGGVRGARFAGGERRSRAWPTYNHPLLLSGCKMVEGYAGHLFSHGINYEPRDEELKAMMKGAPKWREIAAGLRVRYLFWGIREESQYPDSTQPWKNLPVVATGDWGTIYDLGAPKPE